MLTHTEPHGVAHGVEHVTDRVGPRSALVRRLTDAYWGEIEAVSTFAMSSTNRDGIHARRIAESMRDAIAQNLDHAQRLSMRIKRLHGAVPDRDDFAARALRLRPPEDALDDDTVLRRVIDAESAAINRYRRIVGTLDQTEWVTQDLLIQLIREKLALRERLQGLR